MSAHHLLCGPAQEPDSTLPVPEVWGLHWATYFCPSLSLACPNSRPSPCLPNRATTSRFNVCFLGGHSRPVSPDLVFHGGQVTVISPTPSTAPGSREGGVTDWTEAIPVGHSRTVLDPPPVTPLGYARPRRTLRQRAVALVFKWPHPGSQQNPSWNPGLVSLPVLLREPGLGAHKAEEGGWGLRAPCA